ncbi:AMP-binding protein, partial [Bacillus thuringiensis]|nr:AMP-binding protein [Bacillus thuringiensis]
IANTKVYLLNEMELCGIGIPGELCIAGDGLARGYLNQPELTDKKFIKNPFGEGKLYRTGDLARWQPDGNIEYLGRIDEQVKVRGYRI